MRAVLAFVGVLATAGCSVVGIRGDTPEPPSTLVARLDDSTEIRLYAARVAAEARMARQDGEDRANAAFRLLFDYISGANALAQPIEMTAPVATTPQKIEMTAPVATRDDGDVYTMRFFLPPRFDAQSAPRPTDPRVEIVAAPEQLMAVRRFTGSRDEAPVEQARAALIDSLDASQWRAKGAPEAWFYDPPWTLPFLRRNEVAVEVAPR